MVNIAIAGGTGQVAREVIDALLFANKHSITILSRSPRPADTDIDASIHWKTADYANKSELVDALRGVHTLLSFVQLLQDPGQVAQRNLIDAAVEAGVKRFAPSEYGSAGLDAMPWWAGKQVIREYLASINTNGKILDYTLFTPGLFTNYLAFPHRTSKHLEPLQTVFDFENRRAILIEGCDPVMTLTTVQDFARVVAMLVEDEREWSVVSGMAGSKLKFSDVVKIGEEVRGAPFTIDYVKLSDLEAGELKTSWRLGAAHSAVSKEEVEAMLKQVVIGMLLSSVKGAWNISEELNHRFPDFEFEIVEDFLGKVWEG